MSLCYKQIEKRKGALTVVPEGHNEDHAVLHGFAHGLQAAMLLEAHVIAEIGLRSSAEIIGHGVELGSVHGDHGVADDLASLDEDTTDLDEVTVVGVVVGDELGNNSERLGGVHVEAGALAVEGLVTEAERGEVAAVLVADAVVAVSGLVVTAVGTIAASLHVDVTGVRGVCVAHLVAFPDVHLGAASTVLAGAAVRVRGGRGPVLHISLAVNELKVVRALGIAVAGTVLGAGVVGVVLGHATILFHGDKVKSAIEAARKTGNVNIEGELVVLEHEHLVLVVRVHEVGAATNVTGVGTFRDQSQGERRLRSNNAVSFLVRGTFNSAVLGAGGDVGAYGSVPLVTIVAVFAIIVQPAPVRINHHLVGSGGAAGSRAGRRGEGRVGLLLLGASLVTNSA